MRTIHPAHARLPRGARDAGLDWLPDELLGRVNAALLRMSRALVDPLPRGPGAAARAATFLGGLPGQPVAARAVLAGRAPVLGGAGGLRAALAVLGLRSEVWDAHALELALGRDPLGGLGRRGLGEPARPVVVAVEGPADRAVELVAELVPVGVPTRVVTAVLADRGRWARWADALGVLVGARAADGAVPVGWPAPPRGVARVDVELAAAGELVPGPAELRWWPAAGGGWTAELRHAGGAPLLAATAAPPTPAVDRLPGEAVALTAGGAATPAVIADWGDGAALAAEWELGGDWTLTDFSAPRRGGAAVWAHAAGVGRYPDHAVAPDASSGAPATHTMRSPPLTVAGDRVRLALRHPLAPPVAELALLVERDGDEAARVPLPMAGRPLRRVPVVPGDARTGGGVWWREVNVDVELRAGDRLAVEAVAPASVADGYGPGVGAVQVQRRSR